MRHRPQKRMSYAKRLALAEAERAEREALTESKHCLKVKDGERCKGFRTKDSLYCVGHRRQAEANHEPFPEGVLVDPALRPNGPVSTPSDEAFEGAAD